VNPFTGLDPDSCKTHSMASGRHSEARLSRSTGATLLKGCGAVCVIALAIIALPVLVPFVALVWLHRIIGHALLSTRIQNTWPHGKTVLIAYTNSAAWTPYIENELLPRLGATAVVVNRSQSDWKKRFPLETKMLHFWGDGLRANPVVIVRMGWFKVRVFRLYDAFRAAQHGKTEELTRSIGTMMALSQSSGGTPS
jgi:hypothetical protein